MNPEVPSNDGVEQNQNIPPHQNLFVSGCPPERLPSGPPNHHPQPPTPVRVTSTRFATSFLGPTCGTMSSALRGSKKR